RNGLDEALEFAGAHGDRRGGRDPRAMHLSADADQVAGHAAKVGKVAPADSDPIEAEDAVRQHDGGAQPRLGPCATAPVARELTPNYERGGDGQRRQEEKGYSPHTQSTQECPSARRSQSASALTRHATPPCR